MTAEVTTTPYDAFGSDAADFGVPGARAEVPGGFPMKRTFPCMLRQLPFAMGRVTEAAQAQDSPHRVGAP